MTRTAHWYPKILSGPSDLAVIGTAAHRIMRPIHFRLWWHPWFGPSWGIWGMRGSRMNGYAQGDGDKNHRDAVEGRC